MNIIVCEYLILFNIMKFRQISLEDSSLLQTKNLEMNFKFYKKFDLFLSSNENRILDNTLRKTDSKYNPENFQ